MAAPRRLLVPMVGLVWASLPSVALASSDHDSLLVTWISSQAVFAHPSGEFHPPSSDAGLGFDLHASFIPAHWPVGLRLEIGATEHSSHVDNIMVDNPNGYWVDNLQNVETGSRLSWAMIGAQWDPRPRDSDIYLYAMVGTEQVSGLEALGDGHPVIEADVPGLPGKNGGFAWSGGFGSRLRVPGTKNFALVGELGYRHLGKASYVVAPGVEGDYPTTHYTVTEGPVETWHASFGLAIKMSPR